MRCTRGPITSCIFGHSAIVGTVRAFGQDWLCALSASASDAPPVACAHLPANDALEGRRERVLELGPPSAAAAIHASGNGLCHDLRLHSCACPI